jgi:hypothetical protein
MRIGGARLAGGWSHPLAWRKSRPSLMVDGRVDFGGWPARCGFARVWSTLNGCVRSRCRSGDVASPRFRNVGPGRCCSRRQERTGTPSVNPAGSRNFRSRRQERTGTPSVNPAGSRNSPGGGSGTVHGDRRRTAREQAVPGTCDRALREGAPGVVGGRTRPVTARQTRCGRVWCPPGWRRREARCGGVWCPWLAARGSPRRCLGSPACT